MLKNPAPPPIPDADRSSLPQRLRQALQPLGPGWVAVPMELLPDTGLAHDHIRLGDSGWLARIPKQSQLDLPAAANLRYQQACFERAAASGHVPRLHGVLPPDGALPRGALLVDCIDGRPAELPRDLAALARALAALHALPLPTRLEPLLAPPDPLADLLADIERQAGHLPAAGLTPDASAAIGAELQALRQRLDRQDRPPVSLIAFDAHPGNFLIRADGEAVLVDLEKCRYSHPGLDLAHATLYTSTTWDRHSHAVLDTAQEVAFLRVWADHAGPMARQAAAWHVPLRRAMWLWSVTWCAKWRVTSARPPVDDGEDWSGQRSDPALVEHVRERVDHYLDPVTVRRVRAGFDALAQALGELP